MSAAKPENIERESTAAPQFKLTRKAELAAIAEMIKAHIKDCEDVRAQTLLELAADFVRYAIYKR